MDERNRQNENETELEQFRGVLKEVEKRIQKNLKLLEDLREVKKILEMILGELRGRKLERESAAWNAAADENGADGGPESGGETGEKTGEEREDDPLYAAAVELVRKEKRASVTLFQRRFSIGYGRAVKLFEKMDAEGIFDSIPLTKDERTPRGRILKPDGEE